MRPLKMIARLGRRLVGGEEVHAVLPVLPEEHTAVVTGASSGIGLETAVGLAVAGARVVLVGRNPARTEQAVARVKEACGHERVEALRADFAKLDEVRGLADQLLDRCDRIDVLVHNAGLWHHERKVTAQGFEETIGVNHLAPFLLTHRLFDRLEQSSARVVSVSSRLHVTATAFDFEDPHWERRRYRGLSAYAESKLANVLFANGLARRFETATSTSVHPGDVATDVTRDSRLLTLGMSVVRKSLLTPTEGAQCSLHAAAADATRGQTGTYYVECAAAPPNPIALDTAVQDRLWSWSASELGLDA
ncbi:MAG: SDR family NAD(P)-dependent oxidoreductase [Proteobacteria bacterium]|nr:SDR family NAD(P)-dependent oxidoreductase [Pseudomonadota bacterium]